MEANEFQALQSLGYTFQDGATVPEFDDRNTDAREDAYINLIKKNSKKKGKKETAKAKEIRELMEGQFVNFAGYEFDEDSPVTIPLHPQLAAAQIGAGDLAMESVRGVAQILKNMGIADLIDEEVQNANNKIYDQLYEDPEFGFAAKTGAVVGALTEPVGLLIPAAKFKNIRQAMLYSGVVGGMYGSSLYVDENESRLSNALFGAALGAPLGGVFHKLFRHRVGGQMDDKIHGNPSKPHMKYLGLNEETGKPVYKLLTPREKKLDTLLELEAKANLEGGRQGKLNQAGAYIDEFIQPIYDAIYKLSPKVADFMRRSDTIHHLRSKEWSDQVKPFITFMDKIPVKAQHAINRSLHEGGLDNQTMQLIHQVGGKDAVGSAREVTKLMKEIHSELTATGYKLGTFPDYFPKAVRDLDGLLVNKRSLIQQAVKREEKARGKKLSPKQERDLGEKIVGYDPRFSNTSGSLRSRKIRDLTDEQISMYHDPSTSLFYYINSMAEDLAKRQFFHKFGHRPGQKGLDATGADIDNSIDSLIATIAKDVIPENQYKLVKMLQARFGSDVHKTRASVQAIKNLSFAATLGNYWSAMTQLGDLVFAVHKYGIVNSVRALLGPKVTDKERMGITKAMAEMNSSRGFSNTVADWAFKWGGFDKLDSLGKNVNINASLRMNRSLAHKNPAKFIKKWGHLFGKETNAVMRELKGLQMQKGEKLSDNVHIMLWSDLAETQPIGLSEMPQKYLENPNGRIVYAYKTFTLKQMNYMRNTLMKDKTKNPLARAANLTYFAGLFVAANASVDQFKDFMSGKELDFEDKILENVFSVLGTNKFVVDKSAGVGSVIWEALAIVPIDQLVKAVDAFQNADFMDLGAMVLNQLPVIGKINKEHEFVGGSSL